MTDTESIRNALDSISDALHDHADYGPYYDDKELAMIALLQEELEARLNRTELLYFGEECP